MPERDEERDPLGLVGWKASGEGLTFEIEECLGSGSFAATYRAKMGATHAALKIARAEAREGFLREAETLLRVQKSLGGDLAGIAEVYACGRTLTNTWLRITGLRNRSAAWIAMRIVKGQNLLFEMNARGTIGPRETLGMLQPMLHTLGRIHTTKIDGRARGVCHRDVKPENIVIESHGGRREATLIDFGASKMMPWDEAVSHEAMTQSAERVFSWEYGAPEQFAGKVTGPFTDVYACALVISEMLSGRRGYAAPGGDVENLVEHYTQEASVAPRGTPGRWGCDAGPWEAVLARALAVNPADRYPYAGALLEALKADVDDAERAWAAWCDPTAAVTGGEPLASPDTGVPSRRGAVESASQAAFSSVRVAAPRSIAAPPGLPKGMVPTDVAGVYLWTAHPWLRMEMVFIPPGSFWQGDPAGRENPHRGLCEVAEGFFLGVFPVTLGQYRAYAAARALRGAWEGVDFVRDDQHPVVNVTWGDAVAFCEAAGLALPTDIQWEYAAKGAIDESPRGEREYPWGEEAPDAARCWTRIGLGPDEGTRVGTCPVGMHPAGATPRGVQDMAGNVWEWMRDRITLPPRARRKRHEGTEALVGDRVLRGGSWEANDPSWVRAARRILTPPTWCGAATGFRCVLPLSG